jgi:hypothetical protein
MSPVGVDEVEEVASWDVREDKDPLGRSREGAEERGDIAMGYVLSAQR